MPVEIDGISNNLKVSGKKPTIYVNTKDRATNRQRFTLAHEIGHIIIPWHIGTIFDNIIDQPITEYSIGYKDMEGEANAFASELLMPSTWLSELICQEKYRDIALLSKYIAREARVSLVAACFRLRSFLPPGYIFILSDIHGIIQYSGKTHGTLSTLPRIGDFITLSEIKEFYIHENVYCCAHSSNENCNWIIESQAFATDELLIPQEWVHNLLNDCKSIADLTYNISKK
jgi:hypothetical protein